MIYYNLLNELGCGTFREVDQLVSRSKCGEAKEAFEDLWAIEDGWNTFLRSTEQEKGAKVGISKVYTRNQIFLMCTLQRCVF